MEADKDKQLKISDPDNLKYNYIPGISGRYGMSGNGHAPQSGKEKLNSLRQRRTAFRSTPFLLNLAAGNYSIVIYARPFFGRVFIFKRK